MNALHKKYGRKGLVVIGVNLGEDPGAKNVGAAYKKEHGYSYLFTQKNDKYGAGIGVQTLPTFILVNQKGNVEQIFSGWHPEQVGDKLESRIKELLKVK